MSIQSDPYDLLGVSRDADDEVIKKAYRRLAQESHPDVNPGDADAEERFKAVSQAYAVLSDPERRQAYDEFGEIALEAGFDLEKAREARRAAGFGDGFGPGGFSFQFGDRFGEGPGPDMGDLFEGLFGGFEGRRAPRPRRGADLETEIELDLHEAALGGEKRLQFQRMTPDGPPRSETLVVQIPPGVADGARIRLAGRGAPGHASGPPGDLLARVKIRPHRLFERRGRDLLLEVPVTVSEAVLGADFEIPTLSGRVTLHVPPGTDGGSRLRLRGKGIPASGGDAAGDLIVTIRVRVPKQLDDEARDAYRALAGNDPEDVRAALR